MSNAADPHASEAHGHEGHDHDAEGHAHVDAAEGPDELPADEPKTPLWLTALGGGLFLALAIGWLGARPSEPTLSELSPPASASAPASAAAAPPPAPPPPAPIVPTPAPAVTASAKPMVVPINGKPRLRLPKP